MQFLFYIQSGTVYWHDLDWSKKIGIITIQSGGNSNSRTNVSEDKAQRMRQEKLCLAGADGVANFKQLKIESSSQAIQYQGDAYVESH